MVCMLINSVYAEREYNFMIYAQIIGIFGLYLINYRWSSQRGWFSHMNMYGESEKSNRVETTNDLYIIICLSLF